MTIPGAASGDFTIEEATISSVQAALRRGVITCRALVAHYIRRIEAYDRAGPALRSILAINPEILDEADRVDARLRDAPETLGPLFGVPLILKDNYDTKDMPTTGGARALAASQPRRDAFVVDKLLQAGALILAKSNLHELAMGGLTTSSLGGQTRNPYDLSRTPGGSSGGTGAALAANLGLAGTGSDTGQSIRSPASAQSLVGIRCTRGLVSRRGLIPTSATQDEAGPMTRSVEDTARLLEIMAGYDPEDPVTASGMGHVARYTSCLDVQALRGARLGLLTNLLGAAAEHREINAATRRAVGMMRSLGAEIADVTIPDLDALTAGMATGSYETRGLLDAYLAAMGPAAPVGSLAAFIAEGSHDPAIGQQIRAAQQVADGAADPAYAAIFLRRDRLRLRILAVMAEHRLDALLYPHQSRLVAPIGEPQLERNGVLSNGTGMPAICFPGGFSGPTETAPVGVPIGIELLGRDWSEGQLIAYAYAFEQGTRLRRSPDSTPPLALRRPAGTPSGGVA